MAMMNSLLYLDLSNNSFDDESALQCRLSTLYVLSALYVVIMDKLTVKIMSHSCKMADITDEGVLLVEDIYKRRQPLPTMDAIYIIQPIKEKCISFLMLMAYLMNCLKLT